MRTQRSPWSSFASLLGVWAYCVAATDLSNTSPWLTEDAGGSEPDQNHHDLLALQRRLAVETPTAMRKMSGDPSEMFWLDDWGFDEDDDSDPTGSAEVFSSNYSSKTYQPPLLRHDFSPPSTQRLRLLPRILTRRDFSCPESTTNCSTIDRPNSCCTNGLQCHLVPDTGLGDVGCCAGNACAGRVVNCPSGSSSCPSNQGGGCCLDGYSCSGVGCALTATTTVVVHPVVTVTPSTSTNSSTSVSSSTTSTISSAAPTTSTTSSAAPSTEIVAPIRPATATAAATTSTSAATPTPTSTSSTVSICPTNFYQCSAFYNGGGCCQIGRDCGTTSCPPRMSATTLISNGVTVVNAPTGTAPDGTQGACLAGWYTCGSDVGGGCCQSGFACGTASCTATGTATGNAGAAGASNGNGNGNATASTEPKLNSAARVSQPWWMAIALFVYLVHYMSN